MITYRRNKNGREFFRIEGEQYTKVLNKRFGSWIEQVEWGMMCDSILQDHELYTDCSESEFTSAYKEAFDRIALMRIV